MKKETKKALLVTRVSGFIPQHEMNNVKILQKMGYEIHYATDLTCVVYGKDNSRLQGTGIVTHQIGFVKSPFSPQVKKSLSQLKELMLQEDFDLIHCHMPMSAVVTRVAAKKVRKITGRKVPVLYTAHGLHFYEGAPLKNWLYYPVERHLSRYTDRLILINREDYERAGKFPVRGSVEYVPGVGISLDNECSMGVEYKEGSKNRGSSPAIQECASGNMEIKDKGCRGRKKIEELIHTSLGEDTHVLLSVGELSGRKNHRLLIDMMAYLRDLDLALVICGTGAELESLIRRRNELGLDKRIFFPGYVEDVKDVLREGDCFLLPSYQEGLPVAVMEAMAQGLPVVASAIRGVTDLIEHGKGGYLVRGFDPEDYAVKVRRLFTEKYGKSAVPRKERRQGMGAWNRDRIQEFTLDKVEKRMWEIYRSLEQ